MRVSLPLELHHAHFLCGHALLRMVSFFAPCIEPIDEDPLPTVGFSSKQMRHGRYQILLLDLGGGKNIRGIWSRYFAEVCGNEMRRREENECPRHEIL